MSGNLHTRNGTPWPICGGPEMLNKRKIRKIICTYVFTVRLVLTFIYSEKATKFCEILPFLLTLCTVVKSKGKISQNFVAFSEYMNLNYLLDFFQPFMTDESTQVIDVCKGQFISECLKLPKIDIDSEI